MQIWKTAFWFKGFQRTWTGPLTSPGLSFPMCVVRQVGFSPLTRSRAAQFPKPQRPEEHLPVLRAAGPECSRDTESAPSGASWNPQEAQEGGTVFIPISSGGN